MNSRILSPGTHLPILSKTHVYGARCLQVGKVLASSNAQVGSRASLSTLVNGSKQATQARVALRSTPSNLQTSVYTPSIGQAQLGREIRWSSSWLGPTPIENAMQFTTSATLQKVVADASTTKKSAKQEESGNKSSRNKSEGEAPKEKKAKSPEKPKKSLLTPPKTPSSPWQLYFQDYLISYRELHPDGKLNVAIRTKEASESYKKLGSEEMEALKIRSKALKDAYNKELAAWQKSLTPDDIRSENVFRAAQRRAGKSRKQNLRDVNAPKRPSSPYFFFLTHVRSDPGLSQEIFGGETEVPKRSVLAANKWRLMTAEEKQPYMDQASAEMQLYHEKMKEYEKSRQQ